MDDLIGFLVGAVVVIGILYVVAMAVTTGLLNLYVILEQAMAGWWFLPRALSWGLTSFVFVALMHFACAESREFRRPGLRRGLIVTACLWLVLCVIVGQTMRTAHRPALYSVPVRPATQHTSPVKSTSPGNAQARRPEVPRGTPAAGEPAYVNTIQLNVRTMPGVEGGVVGKLVEGAFVRTFERRTLADGAIWVRIEGGGLNGWVNQRLLRDGQSPAPVTPSGIPVAGDPAYVNTIQLNVRTGPGVGGAVVGKLTEGTFVRVLERRTVGDGAVWVRIEGGGLNGWVNQRLLRYGQ